MRAVGVVALLGGCSWLFMDKPPHSAHIPPNCDTSMALPALDATLAILNLIGTIAVAGSHDPTAPSPAIGLVDTLVWGASAASGFSWASQCSDAVDEWDRRSHDIAEQRREMIKLDADERRRRAAREEEDAPIRIVDSWFCLTSASSPGLGTCVRDRDQCEQIRRSIESLVTDLSACTGAVAANCFTYVEDGKSIERCFSTQEGCVGEKTRALGYADNGNVSACTVKK